MGVAEPVLRHLECEDVTVRFLAYGCLCCLAKGLSLRTGPQTVTIQGFGSVVTYVNWLKRYIPSFWRTGKGNGCSETSSGGERGLGGTAGGQCPEEDAARREQRGSGRQQRARDGWNTTSEGAPHGLANSQSYQQEVLRCCGSPRAGAGKEGRLSPAAAAQELGKVISFSGHCNHA
ncbi:hypothetical protein UY3_08584 [Chelonia mydas]|uniref:Uncharacterized protein n=1 Tax=Chelonia mydas TaxID=8469 RepID=M7C1I6_CHEMY|nr:hypothetical protein UY3_08584 [Chelonia mydas]